MISLTDKLSKRYTQAIWDVTETLQEETQTESALASAIEILRNTVACETGLVWLQSDDGKTLTVVACAHHTDLTGISIPSSRSVVGRPISWTNSASMRSRKIPRLPEPGTCWGSRSAISCWRP